MPVVAGSIQIKGRGSTGLVPKPPPDKLIVKVPPSVMEPVPEKLVWGENDPPELPEVVNIAGDPAMNNFKGDVTIVGGFCPNPMLNLKPDNMVALS